MANKNLFKSVKLAAPVANTVNEAGGVAYKMDDEHALAQLAATSMLGDTLYKSADDQLQEVLRLASNARPEFLAKLAVYSRHSGKLKDMPALLCVALFAQGQDYWLKKVFAQVIDNARMLRNFVQMVRSGVTGRKSLGTLGKKLVQAWFDSRDDDAIFRDSVGNDPSMADIIKLAHPRPKTPERQALFRYMLGKELNAEQQAALPALVQEYERFKAHRTAQTNGGIVPAIIVEPPKLPFQMLTALPLNTQDWTKIALDGNWHFVRMNLNTFARHGVLDNKDVVQKLAAKLSDADTVRRVKVLPYQLLIAYLSVDATVPQALKGALQDAMEVAVENVPTFETKGVLVFPDVSGSMGSIVSGDRQSTATYNHVSALFSAAVLRKNPDAEVVAFDTRVHVTNLNPRDSVMTNADKLRKFGGGGTACSVALADANRRGAKANLVVYISDNESWVDSKAAMGLWSGRSSTATMQEWQKFKARNPGAKMININIAPYTTTQASGDKDILNIGGFSDTIFETINEFLTGAVKNWVAEVEKIQL
jgi:60 kDa SS-A/Ro ribonucleoprotein